MTSRTTPDPDLLQGRYRRVELLGTGGMGSVYEAVDVRLDRPVALKLLHTPDPTGAQRLRAEAAVLARLQHPSIVTVFDVGMHDDRPFVVTELVRGRSLRARLDEGPLPARDVAHIGTQLASALACAHREGVVHRDVKPANVLLTQEGGDARLIDFGIAASEHAVGLTSTGMIIGTPAYLAPEQVEGRRAAPPADVYSLGLMLLEALTGDRAFPGSPTESAAARTVSDAPVPATLGAEWGALLREMTQRDEAARPTAEEATGRLQELSGRGPTATLARDPEATVAMERTDLHPAAPTDGPGGPDSSSASPLPHADRPVARRRWPLALALLALVTLFVVLAAVAGSGDGGGDLPATTVPAPATAAPPVTTAPTTTSAPPTTTSPAPAPPTPEAPTTTVATGKGRGKGGDVGPKGRD